MMILGRTRELADLKTISNAGNIERSSVSILCIDDQGLEYEEIIRNHGFNIRVLKDIEDIKAVTEYPVVICDIKGVGKSFGSKFEGGHIIEEIKNKYPEKVVIAYTGQQFDATYNKFFSLADFTLSKDIDSDTWVSTLDETIRKVVSPIEQWKRMRDFLLDKDVSLKTIFELEQQFINAVLTKDKSKFAKDSTIKGLEGDVRSVITSFVASILFKMVFGA
jgi:DNA-binding NtrC family response regulator